MHYFGILCSNCLIGLGPGICRGIFHSENTHYIYANNSRLPVQLACMRSARRDGAHLGEAGCAQRTRRILPVPFTLMSPSKRLWVPEKGVSFVEQTLPHQGGHHLVSRISYKRVGNGYQADCVCEDGYIFTWFFRLATFQSDRCACWGYTLQRTSTRQALCTKPLLA